MKKVIFSKFSNDRNNAYKIRTDIYDENGERKVVKAGVTEGGKKHIENVYGMYEPLKKQAENTIFDINESKLLNGELTVTYLYGDNLEKLLDEALKHKQVERFKELVKTYADNVRAMADKSFEESDEYFSVFGKQAWTGDDKSMEVSNIDMIFANVILEKDKWTLIDYEWSFRMKIPVGYILYRTIHYYEPGRQKALEGINLYELMGVDKNSEETYKHMEESFQNYIINDNTPLWKLYDTIGKPYYNMPEMAERKKTEIPLAVKTRKDGSTVNLQIVPKVNEDGMNEACVEVSEDVSSVMYCPAFESTVLKIEGVTGVSETLYEPAYIYNGVSYEDNVVFCKDDNPYIITDDIKEGTTCIIFKYKFITCTDAMRGEMDKVFSVYPERNGLREENEIIKIEKNEIELENDAQKNHIELLKAHNEKIKLEDYQVVMELQAKLEASESTIEAMKNSTSWKLTKPVRWLKGHGKQE